MKPTLLLVLALGASSASISTAHASKVLLAQADTGKIAQVKSGALQTANASWWGFDKADATDCLQNAINSGAAKIIVDNTGSDWIINKPIKLASHQTIVFEDGVVVQAKKDCFHGKNDSLFVASGLSDIEMIGEGKAVLRMRKEDYQDATRYTKAEWRMGISLHDVTHFTMRNLTVANTGGDGLYVGATSKGACKNILVENCVFDSNNRQGISVISVDGFTVRNSQFINTDGTNPQAGIDFEPNHAGQQLSNCLMENCLFADNTGGGVDLYAVHLDGNTPPISIIIKDSVIRGNSVGLSSTSTRSAESPLRGKVLFDNCTFDHQKIRINNPLLQGVQFTFKDCELDFRGDNSALTGESAPILLSTDSSMPRPLVGGVFFDNTTVLKDNTAMPLGLSTRKGGFGYDPYISSQIEGTLFLQTNGRKRPVNLKAYLAKTRLELEQSNPTNLLKQKYNDVSVTDISRNWHFLPDLATGQDVTSPQFDDSSWKVINGGSRQWWQKQGFPDYHGVAWYRKTIDQAQFSPNQKAELYFNGIDGTARVYVNGKLVGEHIVAPDFSGWNEAFHFDITRELHSGGNLIAIQVTSKSPDTASGINESVYLVTGTPR